MADFAVDLAIVGVAVSIVVLASIYMAELVENYFNDIDKKGE